MTPFDTDEPSSVIPEWEWKKFILFLHSGVAERLQDYILRRLNRHQANMYFDEFTAQFSVLYEAVRPKLLKEKGRHGEKLKEWQKENNSLSLKDLIEFADNLTVSGERPNPTKLIMAYRRISVFLEIWGVTKVEYRRKDPGAEVEQ